MKHPTKIKGFTLIELMIVVAIIGILAAIAIPQFSQYRTRAFNSVAQGDLRNIMTSEEAYYAGEQAYVNLPATEGYVANIASLPGMRVSMNICARVTSAGAVDYTADAEHLNGDKTFNYTTTGGFSDTNKTEASYTLGC
jgi:type IV pilus assembly protein PilA